MTSQRIVIVTGAGSGIGQAIALRLAADGFNVMVNDYRIALFAPELKTRQPVSEKKLEAQWQAVLAGS